MQVLQELVSAYGPPGQEEAVAQAVRRRLPPGWEAWSDPKGNLFAGNPSFGPPRVVVTAHLDEIALIVRGVREDGSLAVAPLGGLHPWKLGEGPVAVLADSGPLNGVLGFGSIHTEDPRAASVQAKSGPVRWEIASVVTGLSPYQLIERGVRPGTRVVVHESRRTLIELDELVAGPFLDDRADVRSALHLMEILEKPQAEVLMVFTVSEEVGGQGALFALRDLKPEVCVALELGPIVPDAPARLSADPTVWTNDGYAATQPDDLRRLDKAGAVQFQTLSRGGSDASIAAHYGLVARPVTLGIPMLNSHGFEVMHRDAPLRLAEVTARFLEGSAP